MGDWRMEANVYTRHFCAKCGSAAIRRNGSKKGQPKYQCTACRYQGLFVPAAVRKAAPCAQVDALLSGRHSQHSIARLTGVARRPIANRIKKAALPSPSLLSRRSAQAQRKRWEVLGLDEWWSFAGPKRRKVWRWLVIERARRRVGEWAAGAKPRCASYGSRCRRITANIAGFSPTSGKPTPRSCRAGSTGPAPKARGRPASSRSLIVPSASVAACSCASPARSASRWPCTRPELKL